MIPSVYLTKEMRGEVIPRFLDLYPIFLSFSSAAASPGRETLVNRNSGSFAISYFKTGFAPISVIICLVFFLAVFFNALIFSL